MLRIPRALVETMVAHCQRQYPKEACGILAGRQDMVEAVHPMTNVEDSPIGYSMDPKEQLAVEKQMRQRGHRMIGIYHSHTATEAHPSSVDVRLAISPDISYVLVSLKDRQAPVVKSYRIQGTTSIPEPVVIEPSPPSR
jgi:proteasome lid subunit RPN8/RPN11